MLLHNLTKSKGLNKKSKAVGRGNGSGKGNYSTRGLKGQGSRTGSSFPAWFEGGQTPLFQRLPKKRGFKKYFKLIKQVSVVNLTDFEKNEEILSGTTLNPEVLITLGYAKAGTAIKILGTGELSKKLSFQGIQLFSASAKEKIEKA